MWLMMMIDVFRSVHKRRPSGVAKKGEDPTSSSLLAWHHCLDPKQYPKVCPAYSSKANMIAPASSTALPTIGDKIIERELIDRPYESDGLTGRNNESHYWNLKLVSLVNNRRFALSIDNKNAIKRLRRTET